LSDRSYHVLLEITQLSLSEREADSPCIRTLLELLRTVTPVAAMFTPLAGWRSHREAGPTWHSKSTPEQYPGRSVVARVFLTANPSVYTAIHESIAHRSRKKEMIQPHPLV